MSRAQVSISSFVPTSIPSSIPLGIAAVALVVLSGLSFGCKSADEAKQKADSPQKAPAPGAAKKPADGHPGSAKPDRSRPAIEPIAKGAVKALMDRWLTAQNDGDFTTYEELYAARLEGVRRSGEKVVRLDRAGWVKERKRMFKRKMVVELSDLEIDVFTRSAIATFTQRWASGKYEDIGPKQIVTKSVQLLYRLGLDV